MARPRSEWYQKKARRIMLEIKDLKQVDIANVINESQQTINYRIHNVYPTVLEDLVRILDMAGLEITEKEVKDGGHH